jgi:hypothetical protein
MFEKIKSLIYDLQGIIASFTDAELVHVLIETDRYLTLKSIQKSNLLLTVYRLSGKFLLHIL